MKITASIRNENQNNEVLVKTNASEKSIALAAKTEGAGSAINGGELLFLALATCFCNDIYREAARKQIAIKAVEVTVYGEFGGEGEPARFIHYDTKMEAPGVPEADLQQLVEAVDQIAEIHNTLRGGIAVSLQNVQLQTQAD